jgi:hypothetical protein
MARRGAIGSTSANLNALLVLAPHDRLHIKQKRTLHLEGWFGMLERVVSAQDEFRGFLRGLVSPAMRSAGLRGSAGRYYMPSLSCFALVGFQKSTSSTGRAVIFTMNLKVVSREVWKLVRVDKSWPSGDACPEHQLPGRGMAAADRQPHARRARSLVVGTAGPAAGVARS